MVQRKIIQSKSTADANHPNSMLTAAATSVNYQPQSDTTVRSDSMPIAASVNYQPLLDTTVMSDSMPIATSVNYQRQSDTAVMSVDPLVLQLQSDTMSVTLPDMSSIPVQQSQQVVTDSKTAWLCDSKICQIDVETIDSIERMLHTINTATPEKSQQLYININRCINADKNPYRLGHSISCSRENGCNSLLRHACLASSHFPVLRSMVKEIYKLRRIALCMKAVQQARCSGNYHRLQDATANLKQAKDAFLNIKADKPAETPDNDDNNDSEECTLSRQNLADEDAVIEAFGKELKLVAVERDTYTTTACSFCEQIKPGLKTLKSLENRKGFDSEKMTTAIEILYQNKTQHEDIDEFLEDVKICSYCSQKLLANKDVARSAFNSLSVVKTPDCIKDLNMFEKTLIKFCMTCITVLRLGHITNKKRPQNELTAALKGRIAYLPVDVEANANFVPDKLLNVNSLCVLVAGQPTKAQRVWTAMVDLK